MGWRAPMVINDHPDEWLDADWVSAGSELCDVDVVYRGGESGPPDERRNEELVLDLGVALDAVLGLPSAEAYVLLVVDPLAGGVQAYGPYSEAEVEDAAAGMRRQFRDHGLDGVSVTVLALHRHGS